MCPEALKLAPMARGSGPSPMPGPRQVRGQGAPEPSPRGRAETGAAKSSVHGRTGSKETGTLSIETVSLSLGPARQGGRRGVCTHKQRVWALGPGAPQRSGSRPGPTAGRCGRVRDALTQPARCASERGARGRWGFGPGHAPEETQVPSQLLAAGKQAEQALSWTVLPVPGWVVPASREPGPGVGCSGGWGG